MKYIDAEKLKIQIVDKVRSLDCTNTEGVSMMNAFSAVVSLIDSLQQEQPGDLEKEIDNFWNPRFNLGWDEHSALSMNHEGFVSIARQFYELGRARKEE